MPKTTASASIKSSCLLSLVLAQQLVVALLDDMLSVRYKDCRELVFLPASPSGQGSPKVVLSCLLQASRCGDKLIWSTLQIAQPMTTVL